MSHAGLSRSRSTNKAVDKLEYRSENQIENQTENQFAPEVLFYEEINSPIGSLTLVKSCKGICQLQFGRLEAAGEKIRKWMLQYAPGAELKYAPGELKDSVGQLGAYFSGERTAFDLELDRRGTPFQLKVWEALLTVPYGETATYKEIAGRIGQPQAVRAVGGANNRNPLPVIVPCHRIIGTKGTLTGYAGGIPIKETLLALERRGVRT